MKLNYLYISLLLIFFSSCEKSKIETFGEKEYAFWGQLEVTESFGYYPGKTTLEVEIPMKIVGRPAPMDRTIAVVIAKISEGGSATDFKIKSLTVPKDSVNGVMTVEIYDSPKLENMELIVEFEIAKNEYFDKGPTIYNKMKFIFSRMVVHPAWWNETVTKTYFGVYSTKKYQTLILATGISDYTDMTADEKRLYAYILRDYIRDNNTKEADGSPMTVTII